MSSATRQPTPDPVALTAVGVMITMGALVALIVAGVTAAGLFPASGTAADAAADRGVWMATQAWATPVGLAGHPQVDPVPGRPGARAGPGGVTPSAW